MDGKATCGLLCGDALSSVFIMASEKLESVHVPLSINVALRKEAESFLADEEFVACVETFGGEWRKSRYNKATVSSRPIIGLIDASATLV